MNTMDTPPMSPPSEPKKNRIGLIIGIIAAILCCCCLAGLVTLWFTGDAIIELLNASGSFAP